MNLVSTISIYAGGPGSGCNPTAGKCGRHPGLQEEDKVLLKVPVKSWSGNPEKVGSFKKTWPVGTEVTVVKVLPKVGDQPEKVLVQFPNPIGSQSKKPVGQMEYVNKEDVFLHKPRTDPQIEPGKVVRTKVKQTFTSNDGAKVTILKPAGDKEKFTQNLASKEHSLRGEFKLEAARWINGVSDRDGLVMKSRIYSADQKNGPQGAGTTVWIHRYTDPETRKVKGITVVEQNYGQYKYKFGELKAFRYKNAGSASGMLSRRYGIRIPLRGLPR